MVLTGATIRAEWALKPPPACADAGAVGIRGRHLQRKAWGRILATGLVATGLSGFTVAATVSTFNAETTNPTNKFASGTLVLSNKVNSGTLCLSTGGGSTDTNANT